MNRLRFVFPLIMLYFIAGCGPDPYSPVQTLTSIRITPSSVILKVGSVESFSASGFDQNGSLMSTTPAWTWTVTSSVGTVTSAGVFTARSSGECQVKASSSGITGTSSVTVSGTSETRRLTTITVTPAYASMIVGESLTFTATGYDQNGVGMPISPTWMVIGTYGYVTSSGLFTAMFEGVCMVKAIQGSVSGGAVVNITGNPFPF